MWLVTRESCSCGWYEKTKHVGHVVGLVRVEYLGKRWSCGWSWVFRWPCSLTFCLIWLFVGHRGKHVCKKANAGRVVGSRIETSEVKIDKIRSKTLVVWFGLIHVTNKNIKHLTAVIWCGVVGGVKGVQGAAGQDSCVGNHRVGQTTRCTGVAVLAPHCAQQRGARIKLWISSAWATAFLDTWKSALLLLLFFLFLIFLFLPLLLLLLCLKLVEA